MLEANETNVIVQEGETAQKEVQVVGEVQVVDFYNRHSGMCNLEKIMNTKVEIIGMGSIGSHVLYALACQGFQKFKIWDKIA